MKNNQSQALIEKICSFYESSTSPVPKEVGVDMLSQALALPQRMHPEVVSEFEEFVRWFGAQRGGLGGTTEEILHKMDPYQLQIVIQRFKPHGMAAINNPLNTPVGP